MVELGIRTQDHLASRNVLLTNSMQWLGHEKLHCWPSQLPLLKLSLETGHIARGWCSSESGVCVCVFISVYLYLCVLYVCTYLCSVCVHIRACICVYMFGWGERKYNRMERFLSFQTHSFTCWRVQSSTLGDSEGLGFMRQMVFVPNLSLLGGGDLRDDSFKMPEALKNKKTLHF